MSIETALIGSAIALALTIALPFAAVYIEKHRETK